jgi:hypothetical protein
LRTIFKLRDRFKRTEARGDAVSKRTKPCRGVTIVETIVALAILTFGAAAIFGTMVDSGRQGLTIESRVRRELLASQRLHEILAAPYAELAAWKPAAAPAPIAGEEPFLWQAAVERSADGLLHVKATVGERSKTSPDAFGDGLRAEIEGVKAP